MGLMVGALGLHMLHARNVYLEYGNTFGVLSGGDSKMPRLEHLLVPKLYLLAARNSVLWVGTWARRGHGGDGGYFSSSPKLRAHHRAVRRCGDMDCACASLHNIPGRQSLSRAGCRPWCPCGHPCVLDAASGALAPLGGSPDFRRHPGAARERLSRPRLDAASPVGCRRRSRLQSRGAARAQAVLSSSAP